MRDQLLILAEEGSHEGGVAPGLVGVGMFVLMLLLLAVTYLFSGLNQPGGKNDASSGEDEAPAKRNAQH